MSHAEKCAIAVMAKAPRPNHVKTRLVPPLTPHEAAALNVCFLRDITENVSEAGTDRADCRLRRLCSRGP